MKRFNYSKITLLIVAFVVAVLLTAGSANADFFFGPPVNIGAPINQGPHYSSSGWGEVDPTVSQDELTLYFASSRPGGLGGGDLWMMTRATKQEPWSEPVNLGAKVNSPSGDWAPKISPDGLSLYFHSDRSGGKGGSDIWMTTRSATDAPWQNAINLGEAINTSAGEMDPSVSADGLTLYFDRGQTQLYEARRSSVDVSWDKAEVVSSSLNGPTNDCHPHISPDGLSLYFSSNRPGGYGAMDIYVATRSSLDSPWGEPVNLGDVINTPYGQYAACISADGLTLYYDESGTVRIATRAGLSEPFVEPLGLTSNDAWAQVSADGLTMYFSSDRAGGCGYQDIWVATRESPEDPWQEPVNLGPAVNSNDWDWAPCVSSDGLELYFTSEHDCKGGDWGDLWVCTRPTTNAPWGPAMNLGATVNSGSPDGNPTLSADKLTLIFSSERPGGKGSGDLWMTQRRTVTAPWGKPVNLAGAVNTANYEAGPCLSPDGRWLFFVSNQANSPSTWNYIMVSALGTDGQWGTPRNLAREVALPSNAGCPAISPDGSTLYFTSDVPEGFGGSDIWKMDVLPIVDFNRDGIVDAADVSILVDHWGENYPLCDVGPTPLGDAVVDAQDLIVLSEYLFTDFRIFVDDDAPNDPAPGNPLTGDPFEDGSAERPYDSIQEAIDAASAVDCVVVLPGTYTGEGNRDISFRGKRVAVRSIDPSDSAIVAATMIDCQGTQAAQHRGFVFDKGESAQSVLAGLTIANAYAAYGGGILCSYSSSPTISKCVLRGNRATQRGGGLYNASGSPLVANCIFSGNAAADGGALYNYSNPFVVNCTFVNNMATSGSKIHNQGGTLTLTNCILWDNATPEVRVGAGTVSVTYSDIRGGFTGEGNIDADPLFADPANGDYHLKSQGGRWDPLSQSWVIDGITSPCIDAGDPSSPVGDEPQPNGGRINMGAYGGTPEASKSP